MILLPICQASSIFALHPRIATAFEFIKTHPLSQIEHSRVEIDGDNLYINIGDNELIKAERRSIEIHKKYIDLHIPLSGVEIIGWRSSLVLEKVDKAYDELLDFALYKDIPTTYITLHPGEFLLATPQDGHAPLIGSGNLVKAVVKIKIT